MALDELGDGTNGSGRRTASAYRQVEGFLYLRTHDTRGGELAGGNLGGYRRVRRDGKEPAARDQPLDEVNGIHLEHNLQRDALSPRLLLDQHAPPIGNRRVHQGQLREMRKGDNTLTRFLVACFAHQPALRSTRYVLLRARVT